MASDVIHLAIAANDINSGALLVKTPVAYTNAEKIGDNATINLEHPVQNVTDTWMENKYTGRFDDNTYYTA
jgi:hypothetical protein